MKEVDEEQGVCGEADLKLGVKIPVGQPRNGSSASLPYRSLPTS